MRAKPPVSTCSIRYRASVVVCHQECLLGVKLRDPASGQVRVYLPGGAVEPGERPAAAARRECLEETGFRVSVASGKSAPHKVLRYPFEWAGRIVDCRTEFFWGSLRDPGRIPDQVADDSALNLGALWIPFTEIRDVFGYHQGMLDVILRLIDPCILVPEKSALCAFSSFKGTMSASDACATAAAAVRAAGWSATELPLADGGRGSLDLWIAGMNRRAAPFRIMDVQTVDPLGRPAVARVGMSDATGSTASTAASDVGPDGNGPVSTEVFIESADCLGMHLIGPPTPATAMAASSRGLGLLLRDIARRLPAGTAVHVGLGDSAVSDCGLGLLLALGFKILIRTDDEIEAIDESAFNSALMQNIVGIEPPAAGTEAQRDFAALKKFKFMVLCDVDHSLIGDTQRHSRSAARVFAPQKGALPVQIAALEVGFKKIARIFDGLAARPESWGQAKHGGASGGVAAALGCVFGAHLVSGADWLLDAAGFDGMLANHRLVFTGEGSSDAQSIGGKAAFVCAYRALNAGVRTEIISGRVDLRAWPAWMKKFLGKAVACGREPDPMTALAAGVISSKSRSQAP